MTVKELAQKEQDYMINLRRELHMYPEISLHEKETSIRIQKELTGLNIPFDVIGEYGIIATIEGINKEAMVALRSDMDALPISEENDHLAYKSTIPNVMHACGHDAHISMLLGAARILLQKTDELKGSVKLCFQQAEEIGLGAKEILNELDKYPIKSTFGIHIWSEIPVGLVSVEYGARMSSAIIFEITIIGKGIHGALPHEGISPIICASSFVMNLNSLRTYEIDPLDDLVISIGSIQSGHASNVIPETATITGTIRFFEEHQKQQAIDMMTRCITHTAATFNTQFEIIFRDVALSVVNDKHCTDIARNAVTKILDESALTPFKRLMPSENYGLFTQKYPGLMAFLGCKNVDKQCTYGHHHPKFNVDEDAFYIGAALHAQYTLDFLNQL